MRMSFYETYLREQIQQSEQKFDLHQYMGWDTSWITHFRHLLLKELLRIQLKYFDRS